MLTELEDRGLMGWDKQANRYDLHPIVRGVVWAALAPAAKEGIYRELYTYFEAAPKPKDWTKVESVDELLSAIELYHTLFGLGRFEDAYAVFRDHIERAAYRRLTANQLCIELLEVLFPDGLSAAPCLSSLADQHRTLQDLGRSYQFAGELGRAGGCLMRSLTDHEKTRNWLGVFSVLRLLAENYRNSGRLYDSQVMGRRGLSVSRRREKIETSRRHRNPLSLLGLAQTLAVCGNHVMSEIVANRAVRILSRFKKRRTTLTYTIRARIRLWLDDPEAAMSFVRIFGDSVYHHENEAFAIQALRLCGSAALGIGDKCCAAERLQDAVARARAVNYIEEELPALTALAELHRQRRQFGPARELLEQVCAPAERGPYPLFHADARNVLACIEREEGYREAAIAAATRAYELAWCDGPPYAYHYGLTHAKDLLTELGAPEPKLPPFDPSKFEPMPDVDLNPKDEFWVDPDSLAP